MRFVVEGGRGLTVVVGLDRGHEVSGKLWWYEAMRREEAKSATVCPERSGSFIVLRCKYTSDPERSKNIDT
jgi:hypothetical protein